MKINTLMSGSWGNAIYVESNKCKVLIDAGQTGKCLIKALEEGCRIRPDELDAIFITHAHRDHVCGAGVLSRKYDLPLFATEGTWTEMSALIGPIASHNINYIGVEDAVEIKDLVMESFPLSHDALEPVGYRCSSGGKSIGIATDSGVFTTKMSQALHNVYCLVLEANYDLEMLNKGPYPWHLKRRIASVNGHLSNEGAGQALLRIKGEATKEVILAHLSEENNSPNLARQTVEGILKAHQATPEDLNISVAPRYRPGRIRRI